MQQSNTPYIVRVEVNKPFQVITSHTEGGKTKEIIITYLTEAEEKLIDNGEIVKLKRGSLTFEVRNSDEVGKSNIYTYGVIDFTRGSKDYEMLKNEMWFNHLTHRGVNILANYDYNENIAVSDIPGGRWYDTVRVEVITQFKHGQLGKPKRCIIFKR